VLASGTLPIQCAAALGTLPRVVCETSRLGCAGRFGRNAPEQCPKLKARAGRRLVYEQEGRNTPISIPSGRTAIPFAETPRGVCLCPAPQPIFLAAAFGL